jgi:hypothetical protein
MLARYIQPVAKRKLPSLLYGSNTLEFEGFKNVGDDWRVPLFKNPKTLSCSAADELQSGQ